MLLLTKLGRLTKLVCYFRERLGDPPLGHVVVDKNINAVFLWHN